MLWKLRAPAVTRRTVGARHDMRIPPVDFGLGVVRQSIADLERRFAISRLVCTPRWVLGCVPMAVLHRTSRNFVSPDRTRVRDDRQQDLARSVTGRLATRAAWGERAMPSRIAPSQPPPISLRVRRPRSAALIAHRICRVWTVRRFAGSRAIY